jgi:AcrR family transcriptional regulator
MQAVTDAGLRERKKQRTREAIVDAAFELFAERGYEATTITDIAAAADIAPRTFFGYFPTKEAVVFHDKETTITSLTDRLEQRAEGETAVDAMRAWIGQVVELADWEDERQILRRRLVADTPVLREHERANVAAFEDALASAVARDLDLPAASLRPRMIAAAAMAALSSLSDCYDPEEPMADDPLAIVDEALVFVRGGIAALRDQPVVDA